MANAKLGDKNVQLALGDMYKNGDGVPQDYHQATTWYFYAARQRLPDAQLVFGLLYHCSRGETTDYSQAM
jgi:TPR repeat protein